MKKILLILALAGCFALTACTGSIEGRTSSGRPCEADYLLIPAISIPRYLDCR